MFSDTNLFPRYSLAYIQGSDGIPETVDKSWSGRNAPHSQNETGLIDVIGTDRFKFFGRPKITHVSQFILAPEEGPIQETIPIPIDRRRTRHRATQTKYRDSSAQTYPWEPPYTVIDGSEPEILLLEYLSWKHGLPAGMHEVEIIERARIKREWDKLLLNIVDEKSLQQARINVAKIEANEWAFREEEIDTINELRMELAFYLLNDVNEQMSTTARKKIKRAWIDKHKKKEKKILEIRRNTKRGLRKLVQKQKGISGKYRPVNIIDEHIDLASELYAPLMRHGEHPKRKHEKLPKIKHDFDYRLISKIKTIPPWLYEIDKFKASKDTHERILCIRHTKWSHEALEKLHADLKRLRMYGNVQNDPITLRKKVIKSVSPQTTPRVKGIFETDEQVHQAAIILQKIIKGRAAQCLIYEGRDKCRELIDEIKSTHALQESDWELRNNERIKIRLQQRGHEILSKNDESVSAALSELEGSTICQLFDFLNKEMIRLKEERKIHAIALYATRERNRREAAEAGRRQFEERRREEHDEIFKQITKVHQDTVDIYLEDIIKESMEDVTEEEAQEYIKTIADKVDQAAAEAVNRNDYLQLEEITADLVHNFVLPEVEKQLIRDKIRMSQQKYLQMAHKTVYNIERELEPKKPEELFGESDSESEDECSCQECTPCEECDRCKHLFKN